MKLSNMINTEKDIELKDGVEVNTEKEKQESSEISSDDQAEMDALIAVGIPQVVDAEKVDTSDLDDDTKAELEELKSIAGI